MIRKIANGLSTVVMVLVVLLALTLATASGRETKAL